MYKKIRDALTKYYEDKCNITGGDNDKVDPETDVQKRFNAFNCQHKNKCYNLGARYFGEAAYLGKDAFKRENLIIFLSSDVGEGSYDIEKRQKGIEDDCIAEGKKLNLHMAGTLYTVMRILKSIGNEAEKAIVQKNDDDKGLIINNETHSLRGYGGSLSAEGRNFFKNIILLNTAKCCRGKGNSMTQMNSWAFVYCSKHTKEELNIILKNTKQNVVIVCQGLNSVMQLVNIYPALINDSKEWDWAKTFSAIKIENKEVKVFMGLHPSQKRRENKKRFEEFCNFIQKKLNNQE